MLIGHSAISGALTAVAGGVFTQPGRAEAASGSAWASRPSDASYTPRAHERHSSSGGAVTVRRQAKGRYEVRFARLPLRGGPYSWFPETVEATYSQYWDQVACTTALMEKVIEAIDANPALLDSLLH